MSDKITTSEDALPRRLNSAGTVSPGAVAEAMEDPAIFEQVARGDLYIEMGRLRKLMANPTTPASARLEYVKVLSRMGKVEKPDPEQNPFANVPTIQIVLPNSHQTTSLNVIEGRRVDVHE
jgi:hypothetical protein